MPTYQAPTEDTLFVLNDLLGFDRYNNLPGFADASPDVVEAILGEAGRVASEVLQPLNRVGDLEGCTRAADGSVTTPKGFKAAYDTFREGGWGSLPFDPEYGGQGLPHTLATAVSEYMSSANMAFSMYPGLTAGAIAAISVHGSDEQKQTFLPKMIEVCCSRNDKDIGCAPQEGAQFPGRGPRSRFARGLEKMRLGIFGPCPELAIGHKGDTALCPQMPQALATLGTKRFWPAIQFDLGRADLADATFRGHHEVLRMRSRAVGDQHLGMTGAVGLRRVDEGHAKLQRGLQHGPGVLPI